MKIFIVPYRNREAQMHVFLSHMKYLLEVIPKEEYRVYLVNQVDNRPFNRGAMRNIGFLEAKKKFPNIYKDIDFVFHDMDNLVGKKNIVEFTTKPNEVNHIFGNYRGINIGGIFVMKGSDFEKIRGYPNFWGWGWEDAQLFIRCKNNSVKIVRNNFSWKDKRIVHLDYSTESPASQKIENTFNKMSVNKKIADGIDTLKNITINEKSFSSSFKILNVLNFNCNISEKNYSPKEVWVITPDFSSWLNAHIHQFRHSRLAR